MISVLIPIYNGIEFIDESVSSVLNQTYSEWELIIGINGHPENSDVYAIAKKFEDKAPTKIKVLDLYTITGKANALNEMIKECKYDYVAILDVDDIWFPTKLEIQSDCLGIYDVIGSQCVYFGEMNGITPRIPFGDISDFDFFSVNPVINSSSIIRKELCHWEENGIEDYDLWLKLRCESRTFFNFTNILVKHRIHKASAFNSKGTHLKVPDLLKKHRK
jgi:glycosyltransferase involved in cell wall biosynthesis